jgi:hypothetical protein
MVLVDALSLIAYFEGCHDLSVDNFVGVIAISAGDSIYVPKKVCTTSLPLNFHARLTLAKAYIRSFRELSEVRIA